MLRQLSLARCMRVEQNAGEGLRNYQMGYGQNLLSNLLPGKVLELACHSVAICTIFDCVYSDYGNEDFGVVESYPKVGDLYIHGVWCNNVISPLCH